MHDSAQAATRAASTAFFLSQPSLPLNRPLDRKLAPVESTEQGMLKWDGCLQWAQKREVSESNRTSNASVQMALVAMEQMQCDLLCKCAGGMFEPASSDARKPSPKALSCCHAPGRERPRVCKNASTSSVGLNSTSQIALYSTIDLREYQTDPRKRADSELLHSLGQNLPLSTATSSPASRRFLRCDLGCPSRIRGREIS